MATGAQITVQDYLQTTYRPDREYVSGALRYRNVGTWEHARMQSLLANWFGSHECRWHVMTSVAPRVRTQAEEYRVPDLVVVSPGPQPDILIDPPCAG